MDEQVWDHITAGMDNLNTIRRDATISTEVKAIADEAWWNLFRARQYLIEMMDIAPLQGLPNEP